jgi:myosin heavy subunit
VTSVPVGLPDKGFDSGTSALLVPTRSIGDAPAANDTAAVEAQRVAAAEKKAKAEAAAQKKIDAAHKKQAALEAKAIKQAQKVAAEAKAIQEAALKQAQADAAATAAAEREAAEVAARASARELEQKLAAEKSAREAAKLEAAKATESEAKRLATEQAKRVEKEAKESAMRAKKKEQEALARSAAEAERDTKATKAEILRKARMESHPVEPASLAPPSPTDVASVKIDRIVADLQDRELDEAKVRRKAIALRKATPITAETEVAARERGYWDLTHSQLQEIKALDQQSLGAFAPAGPIDATARDAVVKFSWGYDTTIRDISSGKFTFQEVVQRRHAAMARKGLSSAETIAQSQKHCREAMAAATNLERAFWASPDAAISTSYRGISDLSTDTLHKFLGDDTVNLQGKPSSSSVMYSIASGFAEPVPITGEPHLGHSVILKFAKRKTKAIPMSAVSKVHGEVEILMHGNTRWRVVNRTRLPHQQGRQLADGQVEENWFIELEELD